MCKFKVGDKVVRTSNTLGLFKKPRVYEVSSVDSAGWIVLLDYEGRGAFNHRFFELAPDKSKRRPHYDLIIAWANGAEIQAFTTGGDWMTIASPAFQEGVKYRIKPTEPTEVELALAKVKEAEESLNKAKEYLDKVKGG